MPHRPSFATRSIPHTKSALLRLGVLVLILAAAAFAGWKLGWFDYRHTLEHVARLRRSYSLVVFVVAFVMVFALGSAIGVPAMPFTVAAGVLFGTLLGSVLAWLGAMLGAVYGYWLARTIGHDVVLRWVSRFRKVNAAVADSRDFDGMLRLRLLPMIPIGTTNFVGGLARAPFGAYLAATAIGIIPSTVIFAYFADSLLEGVGSGRSAAMRSLIFASVLLILLSLAPKFWARFSQRRTEELPPKPEPEPVRLRA